MACDERRSCLGDGLQQAVTESICTSSISVAPRLFPFLEFLPTSLKENLCNATRFMTFRSTSSR